MIDGQGWSKYKEVDLEENGKYGPKMVYKIRATSEIVSVEGFLQDGFLQS